MKLVILGGAGVRTVFFTNGVAQKADLMGITELVLFDTDEKSWLLWEHYPNMRRGRQIRL